MAFIALPKPGTTFGPCAGDCPHTDCAQTRAMARQQCPGCLAELGYDRTIWTVDAVLWHVACTPERQPA